MITTTHSALIETAPGARLGGWLLPFAVAALAWNLMAVLGALANYGDAQHAAAPAPLVATLLRFVLQHLPLTALSLVLAIGFSRVELHRPRQVGHAYLAVLLLFVPLLCSWESAVSRVFTGRAMVSLLGLLMQQDLLTWWFNALMMTVAFGAHMAYSTWRRAHAQTLAWQHAQQVNLALRLRLLQGQLEPYFLSSSLAGIGQLIRAEQRGQATRALARLSDLLRYALRASQSDWQSVADEIQFMRDYVAMQGMCRGSEAQLEVDWQLGPCDWADYRCAPLLLFPMLEQALGACAAAGAPSPRVTVGIAVLDQRLRVELCYPQRAGRNDALDGMRERLAMLYGGDAALDLQPDGLMTRLRLDYPAVHHDD